MPGIRIVPVSGMISLKKEQWHGTPESHRTIMTEKQVPSPRIRRSLADRYRFRLLTVALILAVVLIEFLVLVLMEKTFSLRKKDLIMETQRPLVEIQSRMKEIRPTGAFQVAEMEEELRRAASRVMVLISQPDFPAVLFEVANASGEIVYRGEPPNAATKRGEFNTWKNCLFSRNFEFTARGTVAERYEVWLHLVSWPAIPQVSQLVLEYRLYALLFTLANILVTFLLYTGAIRPLARIARTLSGDPALPPPIISPPRHAVERAYNTMARGTRLSAVHFELSDLGEREGEPGQQITAEDPDFWTRALAIIKQGMGFERVVWIPLSETHQVIMDSRFHGNDNEAVGAVHEPPLQVDAFLQTLPDTEGELISWDREGKWSLGSERNGQQTWFSGLVRRRSERMGWLLAEASADEDHPELLLPYYRALVRQIGLILTRSLERLEALDRGRYEVSIDLSASMGHDLTNILATGRLELETLRAAFRKGVIEVPGEKREMVHAAFEGLRKTTVLLQEVVNVYRAFSYTREPQFKEVALNSLVNEVIDLYRHSTSRQVVYQLLPSSETVTAWADLRLLKLVLFNLLANATQAIAERQQKNPEPSGKVEIECCTDDQWAILRVVDNGTGYQNPRGQRLEGVELQQIFQFDFTTKKRQGGLGLAWVHSIIVDIHQGCLVPANRGDQTGAIMEVYLPKKPV
jgi:signal transduction histidine kinase